MIVFKDTKGFQKRSDKPNGSWVKDKNVFVVDDNSELAKKIESNYPYFDFALDSDGNLIDITPTEKPIIKEEPTTPTLEERIVALENRISVLENK